MPDWPGWDSLGTVSRIHSWTEFSGIILLGLLVIAEAITWKYSARKDFLTEQQQTAEKRQHDDEIARLHLETAQLTQSAESLKASNLALESQIQPRRLDNAQITAIGSALAQFAGKKAAVISYSQDGEAAILGMQIMAALTNAWIIPENHLLSWSALGQISFGVRISGTDEELVEAASKALGTIGHLVIFKEPPPAATMSLGSPDTSAPLTLFVGAKPITQ
jgi:cell division protein FtsL